MHDPINVTTHDLEGPALLQQADSSPKVEDRMTTGKQSHERKASAIESSKSEVPAVSKITEAKVTTKAKAAPDDERAALLRNEEEKKKQLPNNSGAAKFWLWRCCGTVAFLLQLCRWS
jgi:hypothetical protein